MAQSWDEYNRSKKTKSSQIYNNKKIKSNYKKNYKPNRHEFETDALLSGQTNKKRQKIKKKTQKQKLTLNTNILFKHTSTADITNSPEVDYDSYYDFPMHSNMQDEYSYNKSYKTVKRTHKYAHYKGMQNIVHKNIDMQLSKNSRIILIDGYIACIYGTHKEKKSHMPFRYVDIVNLIELFLNTNVFIWQLDKQFMTDMEEFELQSNPYARHMQTVTGPKDRYGHPIGYVPKMILSPNKKKWKFSFELKVYPYSKGNHKSIVRRRRTDTNYNLTQPTETKNTCKDTGVDLELNIVPSTTHMPSFIKIYYELYCDTIDKISIWKGTQKYRRSNFQQSHYAYYANLLIPRGYVFFNELLNQDNVNIKLVIRFLCIEWYGYDDWHAKIRMAQHLKFNWNINYLILDKFKNKSDSILFSKNFDDDSWCLFCRIIKNPKTKKQQKKFYIGLMLINLPLFFNFVKIQLIIRVKYGNKESKKEIIKNIWPGFESSIKMPFKYNILNDTSSFNISAKFRILKIFDICDKEVTMKSKLASFFKQKIKQESVQIAKKKKGLRTVRMSGKQKRILLIYGYIKRYIYKNVIEFVKEDIINLIEYFCISTRSGIEIKAVITNIESAVIFEVYDVNNSQRMILNKGMQRIMKKRKKIGYNYGGRYGTYVANIDGVNVYKRVKLVKRNKYNKNKKTHSNLFVMKLIDYGKQEHLKSVTVDNIFKISQDFYIQNMGPLTTQKCKLAGINVYSDVNNYVVEKAKYYFESLFHSEQQLRMKILYDDISNKMWHVELFLDNKSINKMLAWNGLVILDQCLANTFVNYCDYDGKWDDVHIKYVKEYFSAIKTNISIAKENQKNIWCSGMISA